MSKYVNNYIESTSTREQRSLAALVGEVKLSKDTIPLIADTLEKAGMNAPANMKASEKDSLIVVDSIQNNFRQARVAIEELYRLNNLVSLLLENASSLLVSEVKALEDDLVAMEKAIMNFSYLVGDTTSFNYTYLETFSDDLGRDPMLAAPDRALMSFGPSQLASVDTSEGALVLPRGETVSYALSSRVLDGNCLSQMRQGAIRSTEVSPSKQWRGVAEVSAPITATLPGVNASGAQVVMEYVLSSPAPASELKVDPYSDTPVEILSIKVSPSESDAESIEVLSAPILLDKSKTINFPMMPLFKVQITLNQPVYDRVSLMSTAEDEYRLAYEGLQNRLHNIKKDNTYNAKQSLIQLLLLTYTFYDPQHASRGRRPVSTSYTGQGLSGLPAIIANLKRATRNNPNTLSESMLIGSPPDEANDDDIIRFIKSMIASKTDAIELFSSREIAKFGKDMNEKGLYDPDGILSPVQMIYESGWVYRYSLGIQNVSVGIESNGYRGFHITKPLDTSGDIGEISIRVDDTNYRDPSMEYDNSLTTSIEYSVSNKSDPSNESDWIPILPLPGGLIESERMFPDDTGICQFRFWLDPSAPVFVYKNNINFDVPESNFIYDNLDQAITGVRLPHDMYTPEDIFTITYRPAKDYSVISFFNEGFDDAPALTNSYSSNGSGEYFSGTSGRNEVLLANDPYIDYTKGRASDFSPTHGTLTYQPITVRFDDGNIAINLTNYTGTSQSTMPPDGLYYIQSGRSISFNRAVNTPFRVHYQFMQNSVRVRSVLRCNSRDYVSPKVNSIQVRAKTRRANKKGLI